MMGRQLWTGWRQEQERGITIQSAATTTFWTPTYARNNESGDKEHEHRINIIDTPGHVDFTIEVERSMKVLDAGVVCFDGVAGVEPQSETVWRQADKYNVPRLCFINKLDRTGASYDRSFQTILDRLTPNAVRAQLPIGEEDAHKGLIDLLTMKAYYFDGDMGNEIRVEEIPAELKDRADELRAEFIEKIVEQDEDLMNKYLEGTDLSVDELKAALRKGVIANEIVPVYTGSALKNKGVQLVLDAVVDFLPAPTDLPPVVGVKPEQTRK